MLLLLFVGTFFILCLRVLLRRQIELPKLRFILLWLVLPLEIIRNRDPRFRLLLLLGLEVGGGADEALGVVFLFVLSLERVCKWN